jgi:4-amino-4-deoxy-L-arabinose transferase-like glycosyltransferase
VKGVRARTLRPAVMLALLAALYVACSGLVMTAAPPLPNEGWFFSPAVNLLRHGHMGTTNLVTQGTWMEGLERRTYWVPPMHFLAQAAWYAVMGAGLMQMRALSVAWGVVALVAVYTIGQRLRLGGWAALLAVGLLSLDFRWVLTGSLGRMDMMCAALGLTGIAAYLRWRETNLQAAIVAAHALVCASCLTHAAGVVHGLALVVVTLVLDARRLSMKLVAQAALPYAVGLAGWGIYIGQDLDGFLRQFGGNISGLAGEAGKPGRFSGLAQPLGALKEEVYSRYFAQFGEWGGGRWFGSLQMYVLGLYAAAIVAACYHRRTRTQAGGRALLGAAGVVFSVLWLLDGSKTSAYLPHVLPWLLLLAAFGVRRLAGGQWGLLAALVGVAVVGQLAAFVGYHRKNALERETRAVVRFLDDRVKGGETVYGGAEYQFFSERIRFVDDPRLGLFTGERPDWVLKSGWYDTWQGTMLKRDARLDAHLREVLGRGAREVFQAGRIKVYKVEARTGDAGEVSGSRAVLH